MSIASYSGRSSRHVHRRLCAGTGGVSRLAPLVVIGVDCHATFGSAALAPLAYGIRLRIVPIVMASGWES